MRIDLVLNLKSTRRILSKMRMRRRPRKTRIVMTAMRIAILALMIKGPSFDKWYGFLKSMEKVENAVQTSRRLRITLLQRNGDG